ncbi:MULTISPECIES: transporter substrate-binding domain-containing protein [unclassified Shinella]|uniref:transporter substrate-binding domain-containing protein n=1 Tax=unclassified Shinella TaxID=2643062 RepID=UPI00234F0196|nr:MULTISPECIES: transporter substrate-binding domain-containing protein [unclassified Shinella]MCO5151441.1 transporter substrate-binding domain-containing protein [Shinella sp.]MDC7266048.1 transporter substrate-binding domain-containing protein [Shinella sp. HY16]MDC7272945.1 transporter substrate-binding domain-containing protein [Shinella sp. YZ44]
MKRNAWISAILLSSIALAASTAAAKDWTHVRVGIEGAFPPWNALDAKGQLSGFDVDLIKDICARAKVECELQAGEWTSLIPSLNAGKFDLVMTLGINEKRKKVVDFTVPYASGVATFLIARDGPVAELPMTGERLNLNDKQKAEPVMAEIGKRLEGRTIGVVQSTSQEQLINAYFGDAVTVRTYKSSGERDLDIKAGRLDAGFDSGVYGTKMLAEPGNETLAMTGPLVKGAMLATEVAMGMRKGEVELKAKFDEAIKQAAADGVIRALSTKWSKLDLTPSYQ